MAFKQGLLEEEGYRICALANLERAPTSAAAQPAT
jgi:hypothetical protein